MIDARFTYFHGIPEEVMADACSELASVGLSCESCKREALVQLNSLEWFAPTAIVLYIAKPYLESFLGEMGNDDYILLKKAVGKLWGRFFGAKTKVPEITVLSGGKIQKPEYTHKFSVTASLNDGREVKLMFTEKMSEEEFVRSTDAFLDFLCRHYQGDADAVVPGKFNVKAIDYHVFVSLSPDKRGINFLYPLPKHARDPLSHNK